MSPSPRRPSIRSRSPHRSGGRDPGPRRAGVRPRHDEGSRNASRTALREAHRSHDWSVGRSRARRARARGGRNGNLGQTPGSATTTATSPPTRIATRPIHERLRPRASRSGSYVPTWLAGKVRLDVSGGKPLFVGIAPKAPWTPTSPESSTPRRPISASIHSRSPTSTTRGRSIRAGPHASRSGQQRYPEPDGPLEWKLRSGHWSIVVMNADGSRDVAATIGVGVKVPALLWAGIGLSLFGGALLVAAGLMFAAPSRSSRRRQARASAASGSSTIGSPM